MPVLRSREISPPSTKPPKPEITVAGPLTPDKIEAHSGASLAPAGLGSARRRSPRLAFAETTACSGKRKNPVAGESEKGAASRQSLQLASASIEVETTPGQKRKSLVAANLMKEAVSLIDAETMRREDGKDKGILYLQSRKKIVKQRVGDKDAVRSSVSGDENKIREMLNIKIEKEGISDSIVHLDISDHPGYMGLKELEENLTGDEADAVGKNKRKFSRIEKVKVEVVQVEGADHGQSGKDTSTGVKTRRYWKQEKGKEKVVGDELLLGNNVASCTAPLLDNFSQKELGKEPMTSDNDDVKVRRALSRKDKGKDKVVEDDSISNVTNPLDLSLKRGVGNPSEKAFSWNASLPVIRDGSDVVVNNSGPGLEDASNDVTNARGRGFKERFRDIARKNASRFAHFSSQEPEENHVDDQPASERTRVEDETEVEDWPGPFSTAMKIIRDRESNVHVAQQNSSSNKSKTGSIKWVPKKDKCPHWPMQTIPKLQDLCMNILAKNANAISSLESVPDAIRHKLSHMLCDSRKINAQFLDLLVCGSPTEIRIRDCSWLTEEEFTKTFQRCEASHLMVLQLDQCGRCLPDYLLSDTLARSPNALPVLTSLSIKGACRLSDAGLSTLVASASALRSINLSQCSLLSSDGINALADSLGSFLRELYIDDCQNIDPMLILPALLKLEQLEVLSLTGIQTVSDIFIRELVAVHGRNFKELVLRDCMKLTDSSLKAIAETCTGLRALDLSNLIRLTDSALGYLANGCRMIGRLKLSRNAFSDEAIAAYLEASGESLRELSLNNVRKVGDDTAVSLARRSRNLLALDLSWCRNLTNEALGFIVDSCLSLKVLKLFGCTQITNVFVNGHSNPQLQMIGLKMTPILKHLKISEPSLGPMHYSAVFS